MKSDSTINLADLFDPSMVSGPPAGSVNVRVGQRVEGPGGTWIPCVTRIAGGAYCPGLFEVGPGRKQVCTTEQTVMCADEALAHAIALATTAAA